MPKAFSPSRSHFATIFEFEKVNFMEFFRITPSTMSMPSFLVVNSHLISLNVFWSRNRSTFFRRIVCLVFSSDGSRGRRFICLSVAKVFFSNSFSASSTDEHIRRYPFFISMNLVTFIFNLEQSRIRLVLLDSSELKLFNLTFIGSAIVLG